MAGEFREDIAGDLAGGQHVQTGDHARIEYHALQNALGGVEGVLGQTVARLDMAIERLDRLETKMDTLTDEVRVNGLAQVKRDVSELQAGMHGVRIGLLILGPGFIALAATGCGLYFDTADVPTLRAPTCPPPPTCPIVFVTITPTPTLTPTVTATPTAPPTPTPESWCIAEVLPGRTSVNARNEPWGEILGSLNSWERVRVLRIVAWNDGTTWAYVERQIAETAGVWHTGYVADWLIVYPRGEGACPGVPLPVVSYAPCFKGYGPQAQATVTWYYEHGGEATALLEWANGAWHFCRVPLATVVLP